MIYVIASLGQVLVKNQAKTLSGCGAPRNIKYHRNVYHIIKSKHHHLSAMKRREALTLTAMWRDTENSKRSRHRRTDRV